MLSYRVSTIKEEDKWDGYDRPISEHMSFLFNSCQYLREITDNRLEFYGTLTYTTDLFEIIQAEKIISFDKLRNSRSINNLYKRIRREAEMGRRDLIFNGDSNMNSMMVDTPNLVEVRIFLEPEF